MDRKTNLQTHFNDYRDRLNRLLDQVNIEDLEKVISIMIKTFKNGKTVFICGNGGSAATASHMQADFSFFVRYFSEFRPKVRALTDNIPMLTAVGNDTSFDDIFIEQLKGQFEKGDVIICISASGNSTNVIKAAQYANDHGGISVGIIGFTGGELKKVCSSSLHTVNSKGDYGPIEDLHMIYNHFIVNYLSEDEEFLSISEKI
jgi:D-sedoheptulose 7-phosphate isomerase